MNRKSYLLLSFLSLILLLILSAIDADPITDFDKIVDFSSRLEDFYISPGETRSGLFMSKIFLLDGTLSIIQPAKAYGFLYSEQDILSPVLFIRKFEKPDDKLSQFLAAQLSSRTKKMLGNEPDDKKIAAIIRDLNGFLRNERLYLETLFSAIKLPDTVKTLTTLEIQGDEQAFLNRLLMDIAFKNIVKPIEIEAEIINGVWYGYERVESYRGLIRFSGAEAFKLFNRDKPESATSGMMISLNSRILTAVLPLEEIKRDGYKKPVWVFAGIYVRKLK